MNFVWKWIRFPFCFYSFLKGVYRSGVFVSLDEDIMFAGRRNKIQEKAVLYEKGRMIPAFRSSGRT